MAGPAGPGATALHRSQTFLARKQSKEPLPLFDKVESYFQWNVYVRLGCRRILYGDQRFKESTGASVDAQFLKRHLNENLITLLLCSVGRPIPITNIFTLIESELPVLDSTRLY